ncbi:MAG: enoyl-CoA hydratase [Clostridia bacterium]|nr:enoyl-CoA hydratase [Clostridia bacterium]
MAFETVEVEREGRVARLFLNRPDKLNAINRQLGRDVKAAMAELDADPDVGAVVLSGRGRAFCAGGDLEELLSLDGVPAEAAREYMRALQGMVTAITRSSKPVIGAVNGYAFGAGFSLAMACDLILASDQARFSQAFVRVGAVPDLGSMFFLPRLIGPLKAKELIFTGRTLDAAEALGMGLLNAVVPHDALMARAMELAAQVASGPAPALRLAKAIINQIDAEDLERVLDREAYAQAFCFQSPDHKEGLAAFFEKRQPRFGSRP